MDDQTFKMAQNIVDVRTLDYTKWPMDGWSTSPPLDSVMSFVAREVMVKHRPFIVMDFRGLLRQVKAIVNSRTEEIRHGDRRLFVVYIYDEGGQEVASWGELIFLDAGYRLPPAERYNLYLRWRKFKEKHWPRNGKGK